MGWADLAILSCGAVTVPIYPTLAQAEVNYLLTHSDAVGIFVENRPQLVKVFSAPQFATEFALYCTYGR